VIPSPEALAFVIDALNDLGAPYIVTGSVVSNAYGDPRSTIDADFVLQASPDAIAQLRSRLSQQFDPETQMAFETVTGKTQHKFRHKSSKFLVEIFEARLDDPHEQSRFSRRRETTLLGRRTFFPTAEDVIVGKLRWYKQIRREKDWGDLKKVMRRQATLLDWNYVNRWSAEHGTSELLHQLSREVQAFPKPPAT
jgi:hypothetical protein